MTVETVMIRVEREMIEIEKSQPMPLAGARVTADGVVLVGDPHDQNHIERRISVVEEF